MSAAEQLGELNIAYAFPKAFKVRFLGQRMANTNLLIINIHRIACKQIMKDSTLNITTIQNIQYKCIYLYVFMLICGVTLRCNKSYFSKFYGASLVAGV